ncbi:hypothetical protein BV22DRAFT_1027382 [Leucogyrophana mollusca]|uniref:Uncharacterized protein n=1 Tax=Leucogyrophana mollusca TaxID=85980 RepID=A0ACB8C029_9AGAM|nr:hypothetical protein BV22DRAFT_1027382 [Leucogyrophana mollusca]
MCHAPGTGARLLKTSDRAAPRYGGPRLVFLFVDAIILQYGMMVSYRVQTVTRSNMTSDLGSRSEALRF